ncbi:MAG: polysaccharide biosynthesis tyrosine autokinase [Bacteroidaceae bacterium]|nr:polysaccharide biosynthesis tyrosine autokinase [Bacteroidaceae bacterium]
MKDTVNSQKRQKVDDMLSLRDILDIFVYNWKWFVLSVVLCVIVGRLYLYTKPKIYQRSAVMLVKDDSGSGGSSSTRSRGGTDALMQLNGVVMGSSVKNEVYILQSHQIMKQVVRDLHLDIYYIYKHNLKSRSLYKGRPFTMQLDSVDIETLKPYSFQAEIQGNKVHITDFVCVAENDDDIPEVDITVEFGEPFTLPSTLRPLKLVANERMLPDFDGKSIVVSHVPVEAAANAYGASLKAGELDKESTLVGITCTDQDIPRAEDILNAVLEAYRRSIIDDKNRIAESTAAFIDERIELISHELSKVEGDLASFKQRNRLVDVKTDASLYLQQSSAARQRSVQLESQVSVVQYLLDYLRDKSQGNNLIPSLAGLTDASIQAQISRYNDLMLERNRLIGNTGEDSPHIRQISQNLDQMRQAIIASTEAYLSSINVQLNRSKQEESGLSQAISSVPEKEKQSLDISRQQAIKETLYTYLLNKREETALQLAITEANIRVIEPPFGSNVPISPRTKIIMLVMLLIGVVAPFAFFHIRNLLNMGVRGRKDIETYTTIPVLGEIPHRKEGLNDSQILVGDKKSDPINEAFRMLRFSLKFISKDARVIMFTSTTPGEGKTFVSRNFAVTLGMTGKKVLLLDTDIRKRTQSRISGGVHREGLTSYLSGTTDDVKSLIIKECPEYNVDLMPAGITPPNPSELLMSDRLEKLIEELKKDYEYIVVDNVPAQVVADAGIVNRIADVTLYVLREGKIDRRYLPELQRLYSEGKFRNMCIILNDCKMEQKRYGYGSYGSYGYNYGYGYGYGYGNADGK